MSATAVTALVDGEHRKECVSIDLPPSGYIGEATPDIDELCLPST